MRVALVTGGSKGIGLGIAECLAADGWNVAITARNKADLDKAVDAIHRTSPGRAMGCVADVRKPAEIQSAVEAILKNWQRLDVLVANAGIGHFGSFDQLTSNQWSDTIDTNLTGVFNSVKASLEPLKKSKGYIITIGSLAGTNFFAGGTAYNASKFGLLGFSQALMLDLRPHDIKVSTIMPGSVATEFNNHNPGPADAWKIQPEDIGEMVRDLLHLNPRTLPSRIEVRPSRPA